MARTLLVAPHSGAWREWLHHNLGERDFICLDPADHHFGFSTRLSLVRRGKVVAWSFLGSLTVQRAPHVFIAGLARLLAQATDDLVVESFPFRPSPLRKQIAYLVADLVRPDEVLFERRTVFDRSLHPKVQDMDLPDATPAALLTAQRKARWLQMIEESEAHELDLRHIPIEGLRLGSGTPLPLENLRRCGFAEPLHAEVAGSSLLIVSEAAVDGEEASRALDATHTTKAVVVGPKAYENLICAFARRDGEDFALGRIVGIRFPERVAEIQATAVTGAAVDVLRVGSLRLDSDGRELGELKPWEA